MKGPFERLKYDLRREWECPACSHKERSSGAETFRFCRCQKKETESQRTPMRLVKDGPRRVAETSEAKDAAQQAEAQSSSGDQQEGEQDPQ